MLGRMLSGLGLIVGLASCALLPAAAQGAEAPPDEVAVFKVEASNGYELLVLASARGDGDGEVAFLVQGRRRAAIYRGPAAFTGARVEANLGSIGMISVKRVPTAKKRTVRASCRTGEQRRVKVPRYEGTIEFHGEEGFSEASATRAPFDWGALLAFSCIPEGGRPPGKVLPGARLDVHRLPEENELMLHATQVRPGSKTEVSVQVDELRDGLVITRATWATAGSDALHYSSALTTATLAPPAPFHGHATFRANAPRATRWTGNLTVDLPGYSGYPLVGSGIRADLEHPRA